MKLNLGGVGLDFRLGDGQLNFSFGWLEIGFGWRWQGLSWSRLVLDLGLPGLELQLSLGFGKTLETDLVGLGTEMGLGLVGVGEGEGVGVGVRAGVVRLCLLYLYGEGIVGLKGCDGAGRGGQSVSVMTRGEGTSCREGVGDVFGFWLVGLDVVMQWWKQLTRMSLPFVVRWSLSALYKFGLYRVGWQFMEKNKFWKQFLNLKINKRVSSSNVFLKLIESW